jgi:hypothetical protein
MGVGLRGGRTVVWHVPDIERRCLQGLRGTTNVWAVAVQRSGTPFNHIDFWSTASMARAGMIRPGTSAAWKPHAREEVDAIWRTLVGSDTSVTPVVITVWPHPISRRSMAWTTQVTHCPETRPESLDVSVAGKRQTGF